MLEIVIEFVIQIVTEIISMEQTRLFQCTLFYDVDRLTIFVIGIVIDFFRSSNA